MHDCQKFREDLAEGFLNEELEAQLDSCQDCRRFYQETATVFQAMDWAKRSVPEMPDAYWTQFDARLRQNLVAVNPVVAGWSSGRQQGFALVAASVVVAILTWVGLATTQPLVEAQTPKIVSVPGVELVDDHIQGLDAGVVDYLGQSELFLRSFTKIKPADISDIEEAQDRAVRHLSRLDQRKAATTDFVPVHIVLDEYESVLRDIKNLTSPEEIRDIQDRIRRNGLIANMKVYQPRVVAVDWR
jgi:hypothetical protein